MSTYWIIFFGRCDKNQSFPFKRYNVTCQPVSSAEWKPCTSNQLLICIQIIFSFTLHSSHINGILLNASSYYSRCAVSYVTWFRFDLIWHWAWSISQQRLYCMTYMYQIQSNFHFLIRNKNPFGHCEYYERLLANWATFGLEIEIHKKCMFDWKVNIELRMHSMDAINWKLLLNASSASFFSPRQEGEL